jgi:hypothetical protein
LKSGSFNLLEGSGPVQVCKWIDFKNKNFRMITQQAATPVKSLKFVILW